MKYANAISPERMNATGRVNSPSSSSVPPTISISPAIPGSDAIGAVPPPGITAAGKPSTFAVPTWMNRKAATMRRMLRRYGLQDRQRANRVESVIDNLRWGWGHSSPQNTCANQCPACRYGFQKPEQEGREGNEG